MRILSFSRGDGGCYGTANVRLTEAEVRTLSNILYRMDSHDRSVAQTLNKDFFVLRELMHHGSFDVPAIEIYVEPPKLKGINQNEPCENRL